MLHVYRSYFSRERSADWQAVTSWVELWSGQNLDPAGTVSQYSFDVDAAWLVDNDTQLDGGVNIGLNRATPDLEFYFGISRRF